MGLFDKVSTDGTGTTATFTAEAAAFAKLDLNSIFKLAGQGVTDLINNAVSFFQDVFGHNDCNDQDRVLVERMWDQIPGMALLLSDLGYLDGSNGDFIREDPNNIYVWMSTTGRPHGPEPCNSLLPVARLIWTILFGVRMTNSNYLDALGRGVDDYYNSGPNTWDIPRNAVERAVMLRQQYFPDSTYNTKQWDMNIFQQFPLVAPVPDPVTPGQLYTGEFMGVKIVNGLVIGDPIPDVQQYVDFFDVHPLKPGGIIPITKLPTLPTPTGEGTTTPPGTTTTPTQGGDFLNQVVTWAKGHPLETVGIVAVVALVVSELIDD